MEIIVVISCLLVATSAWQNDYDQYLDFECPSGQSISRIQSIHNNHNEDRIHQFDCRPTDLTSTCRWHYLVNNYDAELHFQCPANGAIAGVKSSHNNHREDRRFSFKCCHVSGGIQGRSCSFSGFVNNFDQPIDFRVPGNGHLRGAYSVHSNHHEDRRWKFEVCQ